MINKPCQKEGIKAQIIVQVYNRNHPLPRREIKACLHHNIKILKQNKKVQRKSSNLTGQKTDHNCIFLIFDNFISIILDLYWFNKLITSLSMISLLIGGAGIGAGVESLSTLAQ